jgi:uncharacterized protein (DUF697 family)
LIMSAPLGFLPTPFQNQLRWVYTLAFSASLVLDVLSVNDWYGMSIDRGVGSS